MSIDTIPRGIMHNADLTPLNTLGVKARAAYLIAVESVAELQDVLKWWKQQSKELSLPFEVMPLGGGSNIVLAEDYPGLVIQMNISGKEVIDEDDDYIWLTAGAGENWHGLVEYCVNFHFWGLENLALIPGNVGAAPIQNIGAYGVELSDCFEELRAVELGSGVSVTFDKEACQFGYRDSSFKQRLKDRYIITSVTLKLRKEARAVCDYPALRASLPAENDNEIQPQQVFETVCAVRRSKLPDPVEIPNVGSFFKNPVITLEQFEQLQQRFPDIVGYPLPESAGSIKLAAGWLIDQQGWKGKRAGPVGVHEKQALVLTNREGGTGADIIALANRIKRDIQSEFGVKLEVEPRVYGRCD